jgi:hypothetical protein
MEHRKQMILRTHWRNPQNERAYQVQNFKNKSAQIVFHFLKSGCGTQYYQSFLCFVLTDPFAEKQGIGRAIVLDS